MERQLFTETTGRVLTGVGLGFAVVGAIAAGTAQAEVWNERYLAKTYATQRDPVVEAQFNQLADDDERSRNMFAVLGLGGLGLAAGLALLKLGRREDCDAPSGATACGTQTTPAAQQ